MKQTLLAVRERFGFSSANVELEAQVSPDVVYFMLIGRPVRRADAERVLVALSRMLRQDLNLDNVAVVLEGEEQKECDEHTSH